MDLDRLWETFKNTVTKAATKTCGINRNTNKKKQTPWWNKEIKEEVKEKKILWKKYLSNNKNKDDYDGYKMQRERERERKLKKWLQQRKQKHGRNSV